MRRVLLLVVAVGLLAAGPADAAKAKPSTWKTSLVGHYAPAGGFNGDIAVHDSVAYLGGWGTEGHCPVTGVKAIGVRRPSKPRLLARFARFPKSTSEDMWVGRFDTPSFHGDLAAVGIQRCAFFASGFRGLALYNVSDPKRPRLLGKLGVGSFTRGVHELSIVQRADGQVLALLSTPYTWNFSDGATGDVRIVDITNPRKPVQLANWDVRRDAPLATRNAVRQRDRYQTLTHSIGPFDNGTKAFVSNWDAGTVFLDLADPADPQFLGRAGFAASARGNTHSGAFAPGETLFVENDEVGDFFHNHNEHGVWGTQRIFDLSDPAHPVRIGSFATEHSIRGRDKKVGQNGIYSVHNNVFVGSLEIVSWYSDGVRLVSLSDPASPKEVGYFVPPPTRDPQRFQVAPNGNRSFPLVWGVVVRGDLVYASDMNSGLWIFQARALRGSG